MRKQVLFILSLFLAINLHAENKFVIEGRVANVPDGLSLNFCVMKTM